ncbi:MAG: hypothetical protein KAS04_03990 [Candidatus Aenigmarchaeota archaeon]|nr:hypothetical protein [Candidatus Aenigmarchaeota archaeon]
MKLTIGAFKTVVTVAVILTILLNIYSNRQNRLQERKAGMPIYLRVRSSSLSRNRKIEESSQSLHRLLRMLQKSLNSVQAQVERVNKENKSGFLYEMLATTIGTHDGLVSSQNFKKGGNKCLRNQKF